MTKYSMLNRFSYAPLFDNTKSKKSFAPLPVVPFDANEVEALDKVWDGAWISDAYHDKNGVHLVTQDGASVHIQRDKVTVSANAEDATLRSLVLHAKENWNGGLSPSANNTNIEQLGRVWAHCQVQGVKFAWNPPPEMATQLKAMVEELNYHEHLIETTGAWPVYGADGLTYRPPTFDPVKIPLAGVRPNHNGLKVNTASSNVGRENVPCLAPSAFNVEKANEGYRLEREAFVQARVAGKISINDIDDWGLRMRMIACDRAAERQRLAQIQRPLPAKPSSPGMRL